MIKTDLHIHSALSPCADVAMTPEAVVRAAAEAGLELIALTDHNSARNCPAAARAAGYRYLDANLCGFCRKGFPAATLTEDGWEEHVRAWRSLGDRIGVEFRQAHAYFSTEGPVEEGGVPGGDFGEEMIHRCVLAAEILGADWGGRKGASGFPYRVFLNQCDTAEQKRKAMRILELLRTRWGVEGDCGALQNGPDQLPNWTICPKLALKDI